MDKCFKSALINRLFIEQNMQENQSTLNRMLNRNQENMPVIYHFELKILFDGYLMTRKIFITKALIINCFLFDGHLIKEKL